MSESPAPRDLGTDSTFLRPVRGGNPFEETVERVVHAIRLGVLQPGDRLPPERDLSASLGVSRMTLRSAIRALQQAGYIESRRGRHGGSFVIWRPERAPGDARAIAQGMGDDLVDALRYRAALEPGAAWLAAGAPLHGRQRSELVTRADEARKAAPDDYRLADVRLHLAIAQAAGSKSLAAAVADVQLQLSDLLAAIPVLPAALEHSHEQHDRIVRAIVAGDPTAARDAMDEHIAATATLLQGFLG